MKTSLKNIKLTNLGMDLSVLISQAAKDLMSY